MEKLGPNIAAKLLPQAMREQIAGDETIPDRAFTLLKEVQENAEAGNPLSEDSLARVDTILTEAGA
ncbi:hypothetical protein ISS85_00275 [Candidatus Microgenomates bacterium]|nr:hypothetical protein [Candidatus Microgenomates bacterium]